MADAAKRTDEEAIRGCYIEMYRAMVEKDISALAAMLDDAFVLVHMTGMRQPKGDFLKAVGGGTLNYFTADHESIEIAQNGDRATLVGDSRVTAAVFGGGLHTWRLRQTITLEKQSGAWKMKQAEASAY